jgi:hypothetical protein
MARLGVADLRHAHREMAGKPPPTAIESGPHDAVARTT